MKDLFVELVGLNEQQGIAADLALQLRAQMLGEDDLAKNTEQCLADRLMVVAERARSLAADIRTKKVGIAFADEDGTPGGRSLPAEVS